MDANFFDGVADGVRHDAPPEWDGMWDNAGFGEDFCAPGTQVRTFTTKCGLHYASIGYLKHGKWVETAHFDTAPSEKEAVDLAVRQLEWLKDHIIENYKMLQRLRDNSSAG